jgi:hypothetical protein
MAGIVAGVGAAAVGLYALNKYRRPEPSVSDWDGRRCNVENFVWLHLPLMRMAARAVSPPSARGLENRVFCAYRPGCAWSQGFDGDRGSAE